MRYRIMRFPEGKTKAITLSYDDGVTQDKILAKLTAEYGIKCTFNLSADWLNRKNHLTDDEVKKYILANGHEVAIHGNCHIAPGIASAKDGIRDMLECRYSLENKFKKIIKGMAYPDTGVNYTQFTDYSEVKNYLQMLGIVYGRSLGNDNNNFRVPTDWHKWIPTCHHNNPNLFNWLNEFKELNNKEGYLPHLHPRLFYLWGHTYEFENDNNWDVIKEFCKQAADSNDIWFATNVEIYEYTKAFNSLEFSVDNDIVYNPSLFDVYFRLDNNEYMIKSGETLYL